MTRAGTDREAAKNLVILSSTNAIFLEAFVLSHGYTLEPFKEFLKLLVPVADS